jgi:hypothetical protein
MGDEFQLGSDFSRARWLVTVLGLSKISEAGGNPPAAAKFAGGELFRALCQLEKKIAAKRTSLTILPVLLEMLRSPWTDCF